MDRRKLTPAAANEFLKAVRSVLDYLVSIEELKENPAKQVPYNAIKTDGFHIWTIEEVAQFVEHHGAGSAAVLALALLLFTGQRRGDVIRMGPQHVKDGSMVLRQRKTAKTLPSPSFPPLQDVINASKIGHLTYITTTFGKPFSDAGFGIAFATGATRAGLKHCSAHGSTKVWRDDRRKPRRDRRTINGAFRMAEPPTGRNLHARRRPKKERHRGRKPDRCSTKGERNCPALRSGLPGRDNSHKKVKGNKR